MPTREDHEVHKDMWGHWGGDIQNVQFVFCLLSTFFLPCFLFLSLFLLVNFSRMVCPGTKIGRSSFAVCREVLNRRMAKNSIFGFKFKKLQTGNGVPKARTHSLIHKGTGKSFSE